MERQNRKPDLSDTGHGLEHHFLEGGTLYTRRVSKNPSPADTCSCSFVCGPVDICHGVGLGAVRTSSVGLPSSRLTTHRRVQKGPVLFDLGGGSGWGPRRPNPRTVTLAMGTCNVTSVGGEEPELVWEVERYRLEIVRLTSTHNLGSGTQLLERGWTLFYSGFACGERRRAGVGLLIAPQLSCHVLEFTPVNERVVSLNLWVGDRSLTVVSAYGPNSSI